MKNVVEVKNLVKHFEIKSGFFSSTTKVVKAVDDISLIIFLKSIVLITMSCTVSC